MATAVRLHRRAERFLGRLGAGKATRLVLSLFFKAVLGIPRVFHFETLHDLGFAILTDGKQVLSRTVLGGLVRAAPVKGVLRFVRATQPTLHTSDGTTISIDEHVIARFTRKFAIRKGFHTIRNKHMKVEKLFYPFSVGGRKLLSLIVTRGNAGLAALSQKLLVPLRRRARGRTLRVILDAGARRKTTKSSSHWPNTHDRSPSFVFRASQPTASDGPSSRRRRGNAWRNRAPSPRRPPR